MLIARKASQKKGIQEVSAMMGTDNNKEILKESKFLSDIGEKAGPNDLLICITGDTKDIIETAFNDITDLLEGKNENSEAMHDKSSNDEEDLFLPRSLDSAIKSFPSSNLVFISLPGEYAYREAMKAIINNKHVMLFSDNVTVEQELALKEAAHKKGLIVMGPDCGTAIINNKAIGFANVLSKGHIGVAAASGTGLQAFTALVCSGGGGISQAVGLGGRDLSKEIKGLSMLTALDALENDIETKVIAIVSKPPHRDVAFKIYDKIENMTKPCIVCFLGRDTGEAEKRGIRAASTLEKAADMCLTFLKEQPLLIDDKSEFTKEIDSVCREIINVYNKNVLEKNLKERYIRGLFSGGTLCDEAIFTLNKTNIDIWSNIYVSKEKRLKKSDGLKGNCLIDLGEDEFTIGVPHPMIDFCLRCDWIEKALADSETGILLLDVVLGYGSHPDPAGELIPAIERGLSLRKDSFKPLIIASVCGTENDPQCFSEQVQRLKRADVRVLSTNERAAMVCSKLLNCDFPQTSEGGPLNSLFQSELGVITMGLTSFNKDLKAQGTKALHCDWRPPAGGNKDLILLLDRLEGLI
jgi:succinyl-CoA synthetase alpha subunit